MDLPHSVAELQAENVTLELEGIDRLYLNCYVPQLTSAGGVAAYFRNYKGHRFASIKQAVETSEAFRRNVYDFAKLGDIPVRRFAKGERKDDVTHGFLKDFRQEQGVVFIGIAQEKATVPRTIRKRFGDGKGSVPWIDYTNGLLSCDQPATAQAVANGFNEHRIERVFRKWLKLLPHPFPAADRKAGWYLASLGCVILFIRGHLRPALPFMPGNRAQLCQIIFHRDQEL